MRKIILYIAMSLDGFIADKDGGVNWLGGDGSEPENFGRYARFIETIDTVILGWNTYHQIVTELSPDVWPYAGKTSYVVTHRQMENLEEIIFTGQNLPELIARLKAQEGKDIWICGGAGIAQQLMKENLIDEVCVSVIPMLLGEGIRLFEGAQMSLKLMHTEQYNGIVDLVYQVRETI